MAFPALAETFEHLSAQTKTRVEPEVRDEVVSFTIGNIIRLVDRIVESRQRLRVTFIKAYHSTSKVFDLSDDDDDVVKRTETIVAMKEAMHVISRPYLARGDGRHSLLSPSEALRSIEAKRSADRRILRRQTKRIDEASELCEAQRLKLFELGQRALVFFEKKAGEGFDEALVDAICRRSVERFPVVNEYLAR